MAPQCARQDDVTLFVTHGYRWRLRGVVNSATHVYKPLAERNSTRYCAATLVRSPCVIPCRVNEPLPKNKEEPAPPLYFQQCSSNKWSFYILGSAHRTPHTLRSLDHSQRQRRSIYHPLLITTLQDTPRERRLAGAHSVCKSERSFCFGIGEIA